jgi:hypothetical protein
VIQKSLSESKIFLAENMFKVQLYVVSFVIFTLLILGNSRALDTQRLQHWRTCVVNYFDVPPQVKDGLCHWPLPRWEELAQVTEYLKLQNISDGEVAAYNGSLIQIYPLLNLHAPTRYAYLDVHARCFPKHRQEISEALDQAKPKFIICNLEEDGFPPELLKKEFSLTELQTLLAGTTNCFPYNQELVFQSHNYLVYRKTHATSELASTYRPLSGLKTE